MLSLPAAAQSIYVYPTTAIAPRGSYQSVTAVVTGVNDKTVTWRTSGGTLVGTNPCIVNEPCTIAVYDTTAETDTLTASANANGSVVATSTLTFTPSPAPATTWPRFLITQANLSELRAKATSSDPMYQSLMAGAIAAYNADNTIWSWSCNGGTGQPSSSQVSNSKEYDAFSFAYMALIDPSDATYNWGCYAHDVSMYVMAQYPRIGPPYYFPGQQNEWSDGSFIWGVLGDWLRGSNAVTTSADLATMRTFYSYLAHATLQLGNYPTPAATYNSSAMFNGYSNMGTSYGPGPSDLNNMRGESGNNYSLSRMLILTAAGLTFNDNTTDAPNIPTGTYNTCGATRYQVCPDGTAGSLRAYWNYLDGAVLYNYWAHLEDPNVSWQAYQAAYANLPTQPKCESTDLLTYPCFGDGRDGGSAEGNYYDYSMYRARWALNMLHTAGMDDPLLYGPQISVGTSSWWDLKYVHDLEILTGPTQQYGGSGYTIYPAYSFLTMGDQDTYNRAVSDAGTEAALLTFDSETGRTDRANALKWINFNYAYGGPLGTLYGCTSYCGYDYAISNGYVSSITPLDMFIALPAGDPVGGSLPADPRPSLPTDFFDGSFNQNGIVRSSWASSGALLSYWFNNSQNNHEYNYDGRFDVYSNGEYITKGRAIFTDYNVFMVAANQQNELGLLNSVSSICSSGCEFWQQLTNGGQLSQAIQNGQVSMTHSELPAYAAAIGDTTNAYNGNQVSGYYQPYNDIQSASRSIVYLRGSNQVVYYDRAAVGHAASTQSLQQIATGSPTISGSTANWLTRSSNQQAYYTSLLPSGGTITNAGLPCQAGYCSPASQAQDWEPAAVLQVTPPGTPTGSQFLSVLEWGPTGFSKTSTTPVQSTAGQNFDGALVGTSLVMFMRNWPNTFTNTTYPASGATTHYISDLTPNTAYAISGAGAPTSGTTDTAGVLTFTASGTGNITVGLSSSPSLQSIAVTPSASSLETLSTQQYVAACTYSDGSVVDCTSSVAWSSSARGVVTVNSSGMATGVAQGTASIIAASGSTQGQAAVTVSAPVLQTITVTPGSLTITVGTTQQFKATGVYSDSSTTDVTSQVNWTSSNPAIMAFNSAGLVSTMSQGNATAIATSGGVTGTAAVTVSMPAAPTFSPAAGKYSSVQTVTISSSTPSATIYYTTNGAVPTTDSPIYSGPITVAATETIATIAVVGGNSRSQVGFAAYTITAPAAAPAFSPAAGRYSSAQTVTISSSTPSATIYYTTNGATPTTSSPVYSGPITISVTETIAAIAVAGGNSPSQVSSAAYTIAPPAAAPAFSPAPGTYSSTQKVTISTSTPSATIYYTTNGATPTTSSPVYTGPITISASETLKAFAVSVTRTLMAVVTGGSASPISTAAYTITPPTSAPTFSPAAGTYSSAQTIIISSSTPSATIYYTTNGTTPTTSSPVYSGPFTISASETLEAIALAAGDSTSTATSAAYSIATAIAPPAFNPAAGTYSSAQTVTISSSTPSVTIYYTTNGTTPTTSSPVYSGPITVSTTETLRAFAVMADASKSISQGQKVAHELTSGVSSATYTITPPAFAPAFSPAAGTYPSAQTVVISTTNPSATIYYTTNGATPTTSSPMYAGPITVAASKTLRAIAVVSESSAAGKVAVSNVAVRPSQVVSAEYFVDTPPQPSVAAAPASVPIPSGFTFDASSSCSGLPAEASCVSSSKVVTTP